MGNLGQLIAARPGRLGIAILIGLTSLPGYCSDSLPFSESGPSLRPAATTQPPSRPQIPRAELELQTRPPGPELGLLLQRHEAMNGTPILTVRPPPSTGLMRTLDLLLPPKATLFSKNPNARRDPLVVDGW